MSYFSSYLILQWCKGQKVSELGAILLIVSSNNMDLLLAIKKTANCIFESIVVGIWTLKNGGVLANDFTLLESTEVLPRLIWDAQSM